MSKTLRQQQPPPWASPGDPYLPLPSLAEYAGVSERSLRSYLQHPLHPLPHYRLGAVDRKPGKRGNRIVVRRSDYDRWVEAWRAHQAPPPRDVGAILSQARAEVLGR